MLASPIVRRLKKYICVFETLQEILQEFFTNICKLCPYSNYSEHLLDLSKSLKCKISTVMLQQD